MKITVKPAAKLYKKQDESKRNIKQYLKKTKIAATAVTHKPNRTNIYQKSTSNNREYHDR